MHNISKMSRYVKSYNVRTKWMDEGIDYEPVYNKKFSRTKIRSYREEVKNFYDKEIPKVGSIYTCLTVLLIDFVIYFLRKDENYYPQVSLKEYKYIVKKVTIHFINNLQFFSDDSDKSNKK